MKTVKVALAVGVVLVSSGCGSLLGVRNFEVWDGGPRWEFVEGQDFHVGMNAVDHVENNRGVTPGIRYHKEARAKLAD